MTGPDRELPQSTGGSTPWQKRADRGADLPPSTADADREASGPGRPQFSSGESDEATTVVHHRDLSGGGTGGGEPPAGLAGDAAGSAVPAAGAVDPAAASSRYSYSADPAATPPTRAYPTATGADSASSSPSPGYGSAADQGTGRGGFFSEPPQSAQPELAPAKSRVLQNIGGALLGLLLTLGPVILYSILRGQGQTPFTGSVGGKFLLLGLVVIAAIPAFLAGWAPAAAWVPGALLAILGIIALFSTGFQNWLVDRSIDWFKGPGVGQFIVAVALPLGLALLFAGLGTVWARRAGAHAVLARIGHR
jgi:hypothetical protein